LALYFTLVTLLTAAIAYYYFESRRMLMLSDKRIELAEYAYEQTKRLKALHQAFPKERVYPRDERFSSAIYDIEYYRIFSLNRTDPDDFFKEIDMKDGYIHYIKDLDVFYLGARYLVIEVPDDGIWMKEAIRDIAIYGGSALVILALLGLYLSRLFVKPMRDAILLLDRFIADTTHELNTPLSTILTNIETINTEAMDVRSRKKLARIKAAAKQVSVLYRDLTYMVLEKEKNTVDEPIAMHTLIRERIHFFESVAQAKQIVIRAETNEVCIKAKRNDMIRLFDNLVSNAVKYNKRGGTVRIGLNRDGFYVEDTGIGIEEEKIPYLFDRYLRFSDREGGFGVGLSIVKNIVERYGWKIDVVSRPGEGTRFSITWPEERLC
jgi:two-component system OmpR family sensor kinase